MATPHGALDPAASGDQSESPKGECVVMIVLGFGSVWAQQSHHHLCWPSFLPRWMWPPESVKQSHLLYLFIRPVISGPAEALALRVELGDKV